MFQSPHFNFAAPPSVSDAETAADRCRPSCWRSIAHPGHPALARVRTVGERKMGWPRVPNPILGSFSSWSWLIMVYAAVATVRNGMK